MTLKLKGRRKWALVLGAGLMAILLVMALPKKAEVQFVFLGYEKESGKLSAHFELHNVSGPREFAVSGLPFQTLEDGAWKWSEKPRVLYTGFLGDPGIWDMALACPTNGHSWRAAVYVHEQRFYILREKLSALLYDKFGFELITEDLLGRVVFSDCIPPPVGNYRVYTEPPRVPDPPSPFD